MTRLAPFVALLALVGPAPGQGITAVGLGGYLDEPPPGSKRPQAEVYRVAGATRPTPTNDWWSSLAWMPLSERMYPHPLAVRAEGGGLRVYAPGSRLSAGRLGVMGGMPDGPDDLVLGHSAGEGFAEARVEGWSDWSVTARFGPPARGMSATFGHGSPFVFARFDGGSARVTFSEVPRIWAGDAASAAIGLTVRGQPYALFGPAGSTWDGIGSKVLTNRTGRGYATVALLPAATPSWLDAFRPFAHNHVADTAVAWAYEPAAGRVATRFRARVEPKEPGAKGTIFALYPHQWVDRAADPASARLHDPAAGPEAVEYASVRGPMRLVAGEGFATAHPVPGLLPCLPPTEGDDPARLRRLIAAEVAAPEASPKDTYWEGKSLGRSATLLAIAEAFGFDAEAGALADRLRRRLEAWFAAADERGRAKRETVFAYEPRWGTLIGYPASYGSDVELNDHHFHYGYYLQAAAAVARRDPDWARDDRRGGMVRLLIRDIAAPRRDDPLFPFLRNFDPYAGHSWACGHARFGDGNNNESSSEAMNAWAGIALWGAATGDRATRDLGLYLAATEVRAIEEYWFDVSGRNRPAPGGPSVATMIWGGKSVNETWFTGNPEMVHGINWLPFTGSSTYLGRRPAYVARNYAGLVAENGGERWDAWPDLIAMYRALDDPADARRQLDAIRDRARFEAGDSPANAEHWVAALGRLGRVAAIAADDPFAVAFDAGSTRTRVVYAHDPGPRTVRFGDGGSVEVRRRGFTIGTGSPGAGAGPGGR